MVQISSGARRPTRGWKNFGWFKSVAVALTLIGVVAPARAQFFGQPQQPAPQPAPVSDAAALVRIDRLENQVRNLNGQVEQLQYQVKRLEDQLRKFQMDVDQRFLDAAPAARSAPAPRAPAPAPQKRSELDDLPADAAPVAANAAPAADPNAPPPEAALAGQAPSDPAIAAAPDSSAAAPVAAAVPTVTVGADGRRHDAFDPGAAPNAPGAPLPLGSPESASRPLGSPESASRPAARAEAAPSGPLDITSPEQRGATSAALAPASPSSAADPVREQYDSAIEQLRQERYDAAQQALSAFIAANPHSRLVGPAIFHLGESFAAQGRHREAAEQFLKIAQDYSRAAVAPEAMVKLGVSLLALGAKEQACAVFADAPRKYPNITPAQRAAAEREAKRAAC